MAYRNPGHRIEVFASDNYRRMATEWIENDTPVPLSMFQKAFGDAFFNRNGKSFDHSSTATSRNAFVNLMKWTGRAPDEVETWEDWLEFNDYG